MGHFCDEDFVNLDNAQLTPLKRLMKKELILLPYLLTRLLQSSNAISKHKGQNHPNNVKTSRTICPIEMTFCTNNMHHLSYPTFAVNNFQRKVFRPFTDFRYFNFVPVFNKTIENHLITLLTSFLLYAKCFPLYAKSKSYSVKN